MTNHVVLNYSQQPQRLRCLHCGADEPITLPMPIRQLVVITDSFVKEHRSCRPRPNLTPAGSAPPVRASAAAVRPGVDTGIATPKPDIISQGQDPGPVRHISVGYQPLPWVQGPANPPPKKP